MYVPFRFGERFESISPTPRRYYFSRLRAKHTCVCVVTEKIYKKRKTANKTDVWKIEVESRSFSTHFLRKCLHWRYIVSRRGELYLFARSLLRKKKYFFINVKKRKLLIQCYLVME